MCSAYISLIRDSFWQAHVRGHQVRKYYKVICWAVGILEKVVLRWRRGGVGLRGFRNESESIDGIEDKDEDIVTVFRKQKILSIDEAVARVLSMVTSSEARQQYRRMLDKYRQAKVIHGLHLSSHMSCYTSDLGVQNYIF